MITIFKQTTLIIFLSLLSQQLWANNLMIELNANYHSDTDNVETYKYSTTIGQGFIGAAITKSGQMFFGQNITSFSRAYTVDSTDYKYSILELGPRISYYFDTSKTWLLSMIWNPFSQGTRENDSVTEKVKGTSMEFGFGYQVKVSKSLSLGVIMTYHALSITTVTDTANLESTVSETYTSIYPMFSISMRF